MWEPRYREGRTGRHREIGGRPVRKEEEGFRGGGPEGLRQAHQARAGHGPEDAGAQGLRAGEIARGAVQVADLDELGRCGTAYACVGTDIMPTEERGQIGRIKPSGWQTVKYDFIDGKYLYNRCHLIAYRLTGENANEKNLITGTRYLNVTGMLPFENMVANYVKTTGNHALYRVTPVFENDDLVAKGVLIEAKSVEDKGEGVTLCVYCYNVQPNVTIDYKTGKSEYNENEY